MGDILPLRIEVLYEVDLPCPWPVLDRLFSRNSIRHQIVSLKPYERLDVVACCEPGRQVVLVFI